MVRIFTNLNCDIMLYGMIRNTDYILVPEACGDEAIKVLESDGWKFENKTNAQPQSPGGH